MTVFRKALLLPFAGFTALLAGCGGSTGRPVQSSIRSISGFWSGTFRYQFPIENPNPGTLNIEIVPSPGRPNHATITGTVIDPAGETATVEGEFVQGRVNEVTVVFRYPDRLFITAFPGRFSVRKDRTLHIDPDYSYGGAPETIAYAQFDLVRPPTF